MKLAWGIRFVFVALLVVPVSASAQSSDPRNPPDPSLQTYTPQPFKMPPQLLSVFVGYGISAPEEREGDDESIDGEGFLGGAEYILKLNDWVSPRGYGALAMTFGHVTDSCRQRRVPCDVSARIVVLGVKGRLTIPIPYVAPFIELGIGMSLGNMRTRTLRLDQQMGGATYHVPFAIGLSLGEDHSVDLAFQYWFHPSEDQFNGGLLAGLTFVLDPG